MLLLLNHQRREVNKEKSHPQKKGARRSPPERTHPACMARHLAGPIFPPDQFSGRMPEKAPKMGALPTAEGAAFAIPALALENPCWIFFRRCGDARFPCVFLEGQALSRPIFFIPRGAEGGDVYSPHHKSGKIHMLKQPL